MEAIKSRSINTKPNIAPTAVHGSKPYILVAKDKFELNCNGWELFLALKVLFVEIAKTQPEFFGLLCKKLVDCKAFKI